MKIRIVWIGKTKNQHNSALCQDYLERTRRFTPCELIVLRETPRQSRRATTSQNNEEEKLILAQLTDSPCSILLDVAGKEMDSAGFADMIQRHRLNGTKRMDFVLGGPWGWSEEIRARATERLMLSRMTLPHELARVVLMEQLYRAMARIHGRQYEK